jgi:hypothetical protein
VSKKLHIAKYDARLQPKIKRLAELEGKLQQEVLDDAIEAYIAQFEQKIGRDVLRMNLVDELSKSAPTKKRGQSKG